MGGFRLDLLALPARFNIVPEIFFCQIPEMVQKTWVLFQPAEGV